MVMAMNMEVSKAAFTHWQMDVYEPVPVMLHWSSPAKVCFHSRRMLELFEWLFRRSGLTLARADMATKELTAGIASQKTPKNNLTGMDFSYTAHTRMTNRSDEALPAMIATVIKIHQRTSQ